MFLTRYKRKLNSPAPIWRTTGFCLIGLITPSISLSDPVAILKSEALHLDGAARLIESGKIAPELAYTSTATPGLVDIYIGTNTKALLLQSVVIRVDQGERYRYDYSDIESEALNRGGLHPITSVKLPAGEHRLKASFIARDPDSSGSQQIVAEFNHSVTISDPLTRLELVFDSRGFMNFFRGASIELKQWRPTP